MPNTSSIEASLTEYEELDGIRELSFSDFEIQVLRTFIRNRKKSARRRWLRPSRPMPVMMMYAISARTSARVDRIMDRIHRAK